MKDRVLSEKERKKLHPNELEVVQTYERITKNHFMRFELVPLKKLIKVATPAQIISQINRFYKLYPQNFTDFHYIVPPVRNMFKNKRGKGGGDHA